MEHGGSGSASASEMDSRLASLWPPMADIDARQYTNPGGMTFGISSSEVDFMRRLAQTYPADMPHGYGRAPAPAARRRRLVLVRPQYGVTELIDRHGVARVVQRGDHDDDDAYGNGRFGAVPASEAEIATRLPLAAAGEAREKSCAVCLESFEAGEVVRMMPCPSSHGFHEKCILRWLRVSRLCRFPLLAETV